MTARVILAGMPLLLADRARHDPPISLLTTEDARISGFRPSPPEWVAVRRGIHVRADEFEKLTPWQRYAVRVHAYLRNHPDAILCMESAAVIHGLPGFGETRFIHVYDAGGAHSQRYGDVRVHAWAATRDVEVIRGIAVTSLADTAVDLARVMPPAEALAVVDSALSSAQGGGLVLDDLTARDDHTNERRGRARVRWVFGHADGRSESPHESVSRAVIIWSGFEIPELQRCFHYDGHEDRSDFYFKSCRGIGEADGWEKYRFDVPGDPAAGLRQKKRREDRLRSHGHSFARWEPADAWRVAPLVQALGRAGVPLLHPARPALLETLRSRPRALPSRRRA